MIQEIHAETKLPVIAGGLIKEESDIEQAIKAGAVAVTTSNPKLWNQK